MDDAEEVLSALRLGWSVAEMRGRNRPGGPVGDISGMPDYADHPLPLRIERGRTELRIEVQSVVAELAQVLRVDDSADGASFAATLGDKAKLLGHIRAPKAAEALRQAAALLEPPAAAAATAATAAVQAGAAAPSPPDQAGAAPSSPDQAGAAPSSPDQAAVAPLSPHQAGAAAPSPPDQAPGAQQGLAAQQALEVLEQGLAAQQAVVVRRQQAVAVAQQALAETRQQVKAGGLPGEAQTAPAAAVQAAGEAALQLELACRDAEAEGATALEQVIGTLRQVVAASPQTAAQAGIDCVRQCQQAMAAAARQPWADLAELIWRFDAHVQDRLAAISESQSIGYQLGRGLADTYWALDPGQQNGSASWSFLLGERRCDELSRLTGRLAAYMREYTAPAIAGSLEVWKDVARTPAWLGDAQQADLALYNQIRRWFELIILGQDPTTLIGPAAVMKNYRTVARALQLFWPELVATIVGLAFLIILLFLISAGAAGWAKTLSAILAAVGFSLAGLTGTLKNSAQALLKRLRQDAYTDLVAIAVQTAPAPPDKSALQNAINRRRLTPATPN